MKQIYSMLLLWSIHVEMNAEVGCMARSKDMCRYDGYDYKILHPVFCTCPCRRYPLITERSRCSMCRHYRSTDLLY